MRILRRPPLPAIPLFALSLSLLLGVAPEPVAAGTMAYLTRLPTPAGTRSRAYGLNAQGDVVGAVIRRVTTAVRWRAGDLLELGTLGGASSKATGINTAGAIVGRALTATGRPHAFRWAAGRMTDLDTRDTPASGAVAINAPG